MNTVGFSRRAAIRNTRSFVGSFISAIGVCLSAALPGCAIPNIKVGGDGVVVVDKARFTIITSECIRIESAGADGKFVDQRSLFAVNREARFTQYRLMQTPEQTTIDTGVIQLTYKPDGKPLGDTNLSATIRKGQTPVSWKPGDPNPGNLGGTVTTLDKVNGALDLGQGIISRDGWYLLDDSRNNLLTADWVERRPSDTGLDWYLFGYGDDYRGALKSLTTIAGPVPMPRKYLLGAWYSRYWPYTSADYRQIIAQYAEHDFPIDNIVMDMDWHTDGWTGWTWNRKLLPDYEGLLADFHRQGLFVTLNTHPADGIAPKEEMYGAFMQAMGQDPTSGKTIPFDAGNKKYLDTMFAATHDPLVKNGVDFWWLDWQQDKFTRSIPDLTNLFWLNTYYYQYTARNNQRGVSFSRWAGWGDHRHPIHFSGDAGTGWDMLRFEVPMTATAGNVGCFFWSHDIGGHQYDRNDEAYTRWCQFGALSAALRSHSTRDQNMDRRPWTYPQWAEASMRQSFHLRSELFPYIYTSVAEAARETIPLTRPLYLDSPGDERAYHNGQEYLFGDNLLVAPITARGVGPGRVGRQVVYFPEGVWYNIFSGERFEGPTEVLVSADINELPLYARGGAPLPLQPYSQRMATAPLNLLRVRCFPGPDGKTITSSLYEDDGVTDAYKEGKSATTPLTYTRRGSEVTIAVGPTTGTFPGQIGKRRYTIELPNTEKPTNATVNGQPQPFQYNAVTKTTEILLAERPITEAVSIAVTFIKPEVDNEPLKLAAAQRRLSGVLGVPVKPGSLLQLATLASTAPDSEAREAALAVCGIGLVAKSEAPYLYGGKTNLSFYAPQGLVDGNNYQRVSEDGYTVPSSASPIAPGANVLATLDTPSTYRPTSLVAFTIGTKRFTLPDTSDSRNNVARLAKVTVSSVENGYGSEGLTDGLIEGFPENKKGEWSSNELVNASCTLTWDSPQTVNRIRLYDRPNSTDQITSGKLIFSDGTSISVGVLPNGDRTPLEIKFPSKTITSVTFRVTGVKPKSEHAGLAEFEVFRATPANQAK